MPVEVAGGEAYLSCRCGREMVVVMIREPIVSRASPRVTMKDRSEAEMRMS